MGQNGSANEVLKRYLFLFLFVLKHNERNENEICSESLLCLIQDLNDMSSHVVICVPSAAIQRVQIEQVRYLFLLTFLLSFFPRRHAGVGFFSALSRKSCKTGEREIRFRWLRCGPLTVATVCIICTGTGDGTKVVVEVFNTYGLIEIGSSDKDLLFRGRLSVC